MGQARRMVGQAPWSGPEESLNLFMTNSAVSCVFFLAIILPHCFINLHTLTSRCCVYIYG